MDRSAAQAAFSQFLNDRSLIAQQIRFVEMVIDQCSRGKRRSSTLFLTSSDPLNPGTWLGWVVPCTGGASAIKGLDQIRYRPSNPAPAGNRLLCGAWTRVCGHRRPR
jgi:hypothetical protein